MSVYCLSFFFLMLVIVRKIKATIGFVGLLNIIVSTYAAEYPNCDYYQEMRIDVNYYVYNNEYPSQYPPGTACRWVGQTTPNAVIKLICEDINLPQSIDCQQDKLVISTSGDSDFQDNAHSYCGIATLNLFTEANRISIGLTSTSNSTGGRFSCTITAKQSSTIESSADCDCGQQKSLSKIQGRIVGGMETGINEFPLMAGLVHLQKREISCGASIIASRYALSTTFCVLNENAETFGLLVGDHDMNTGDDTASAVLYIIEQIMKHPMYNPSTKENDISIIKTEQAILFGENVGPVCLPFRFSNFDFNGQTVLALGWGATGFSEAKSPHLKKVDVNIVSNTYCQEFHNATISSSVLCSYSDEKGACHYDTGGPLLWYDFESNRLQQIGIISSGIQCGGELPELNTRVTSFLDWIISVTADADYCNK